MARIEKELREKHATDFSAKFVCALSVAMPHGEVASFEGEVHGTLTFPPRGTQGFGYDPIFIKEAKETFGRWSRTKTRHEFTAPVPSPSCLQWHV